MYRLLLSKVSKKIIFFFFGVLVFSDAFLLPKEEDGETETKRKL